MKSILLGLRLMTFRFTCEGQASETSCKLYTSVKLKGIVCVSIICVTYQMYLGTQQAWEACENRHFHWQFEGVWSEETIHEKHCSGQEETRSIMQVN